MRRSPEACFIRARQGMVRAIKYGSVPSVEARCKRMATGGGFRLAMIEIDIEFEELEEKTAPQADTTYLEFVTRWR